MTRIIGKVGKSAQTPLSGIIRVTLDSSIFDDSSNPDKVLFPIAEEFDFDNGEIDLDLVASEEENVSYHFELFTVDNLTTYYLANSSDIYTGATHLHDDGAYYTGNNHTTESVRLDAVTEAQRNKFDDFHAIIPNLAEVQLRELIPQGVAVGGAEQGLHRLARILATNDQYVAALRGRYQLRGVFNPNEIYRLNDLVYYNGGTSIYVNQVPSKGNYPIRGSITGYWFPNAEPGERGAGASGNNAVYDAVAWLNQLDAPSRNVLTRIIEQLARKSELSKYALIDSPNFINGANAKTPSDGSTGTSVVNIDYVSRFALLESAALKGLPSTTTPLLGDRTGRVANTEWVGATLDAELKRHLVYDEQTGSSVVELNTNGEATVIFPRRFINEPTIVVCNGDTGSAFQAVGILRTSTQPSQLGSFQIKVITGGPIVQGSLFRVNWTAKALR